MVYKQLEIPLKYKVLSPSGASCPKKAFPILNLASRFPTRWERPIKTDPQMVSVLLNLSPSEK